MKIKNVLWGIIFIVVGIIMGLNALNFTDINLFFDGWWTFIIIIPSFIDLFDSKNRKGSLIGLIIGISLYLMCINIISIKLIANLIIPFILIALGFSIIFNSNLNNKIRKQMKNLNIDTEEEYYSIFSNRNINLTKDISGCNLNSIFGGLTCNIKDTKVTKDIIINATSVFGSIKLIVPDEVDVKVISTPIFGSISNKIKRKDSKYCVFVKGFALFGDIEIN